MMKFGQCSAMLAMTALLVAVPGQAGVLLPSASASRDVRSADMRFAQKLPVALPVNTKANALLHRIEITGFREQVEETRRKGHDKDRNRDNDEHGDHPRPVSPD